MKPEPLKNKELSLALYLDSFDKEKYPPIYLGKDIKSAVEWLKAELKENMIYLHRGDKTYLFKQIDKVFEDIIEKH